MALVAGLVLGGGLAGAAEYSDTRLHSERELRKLVSADIIADVPSIMTPLEEGEVRRQNWYTLFAAAAILCCMLVGFAITYLHR
jgi:hypothetical protein